MREFTESLSRHKVDLDDESTYSYLPNTIEELNSRMLKEIGFATCYMDYWHSDVFNKRKKKPNDRRWTPEEIELGYPDKFTNAAYYQRQRVYKLIERFTKERKNNLENIMWFKEMVFLFEDEIENMC